MNEFPVLLGFFEGNILKMTDGRNFQTKIKLNSGSEYLKIEQHLEYRSFIETNELFLTIQTVNSADRMLAGVYKFRAVNAMEYTPIKDMPGEYSISSRDTGSWKSDKDGEIYLDHLKVGLTNLQIK